MLYALIAGIGLGIVMALPTGPIGFFVMRRMFVYGIRAGLWSAVGSVAGDMVYFTVALIGIKHVMHFLLSLQDVFRIGIGLLILYIGIRALKKSKKEPSQKDPEFNEASDFGSAFALAAGSVHNLGPFIAAFALVGVGVSIVSVSELALFTISFLLGSFLWWFVCGLWIREIRKRRKIFSDRVVRVFTAWLLIASGSFFVAFGIAHTLVAIL